MLETFQISGSENCQKIMCRNYMYMVWLNIGIGRTDWRSVNLVAEI